MHTIFWEFLGGLERNSGGRIVIEGDESAHAIKVKRLKEGERVRLLDGAGLVATGHVVEAKKRGLEVEIEGLERVLPVSPRVDVMSATPKGNRLDRMIDALAQVGVARWSPLHTIRGVVEPRDTKIERIERIAREASKQCGRAWLMECGPAQRLAQALRHESVVLADASGEVYRGTGSGSVRVLVGAEGGWTEEEIGMAREAGAQVARFGVHVMRIETAAVVAASAVLLAEGAREPRSAGAVGDGKTGA